ncbi:MAG: hypothetical protein CMO81_00080 [Waddliaceae bacterium]|nr:hypothetical protein [Waddliaceae bacterium]|tara:strand:+ start:866 stop:1333 length:468 start_codon:yes stop_codon:yes gene_type:complete
MLKKYLFGIFALISTYLIADSFLPNSVYGLRINRTDSLPQTVFISYPLGKEIQKGDYVTYSHEYSLVPLAKVVVGVAGDTIDVSHDSIFISGKKYGKVQPRTLDCGINLHPIKKQKIPEGYVFLHAPHADSFDSRYQEFGLIRIEDLEESLWPVL